MVINSLSIYPYTADGRCVSRGANNPFGYREEENPLGS